MGAWSIHGAPVSPIWLAQFVFEHLSCAGDRQGIHELDGARALEMGDEIARVRGHFIGRNGVPGFADHECMHRLAP